MNHLPPGQKFPVKFTITSAAFCLLAAVSAISCGIRLVPIDRAGWTVDLKAGTSGYVTESIQIVARRGELKRPAGTIEDYIFPVHMTIRNHSGGKIAFLPQDFVLLDQGGMQYPAIDPRQLIGIVSKQYPSRFNVFPYFGFMYGYDPYAHAAGYGALAPAYSSEYWEEIFLKALPDGEIFPGAAVSGLVYFRTMEQELKEITVVVTKEIEPGRTAKWEFPFKVE